MKIDFLSTLRAAHPDSLYAAAYGCARALLVTGFDTTELASDLDKALKQVSDENLQAAIKAAKEAA
jgi:hypothetical protein